eukprot:1213814-Rhodomonas_salina.2
MGDFKKKCKRICSEEASPVCLMIPDESNSCSNRRRANPSTLLFGLHLLRCGSRVARVEERVPCLLDV